MCLSGISAHWLKPGFRDCNAQSKADWHNQELGLNLQDLLLAWKPIKREKTKIKEYLERKDKTALEIPSNQIGIYSGTQNTGHPNTRNKW